jgi:hypothetical protein
MPQIPPKSKEDRVAEAVKILKQLKEANMSERSSYILIKQKLDEWINNGEYWKGKIKMPEYNYVAHITLPSSYKEYASILLKYSG